MRIRVVPVYKIFFGLFIVIVEDENSDDEVMPSPPKKSKLPPG